MEQENRDLWGNIIVEDVLLRDKFIEPPFSVLDTKSGNWQRRKREWMKIGMKSEIGRDSVVINMDTKAKDKNSAKYISIFDPALCEVLYNWFCVDGKEILDPFAGGSVRGIVANKLGFKYTGIDIRQEQVDSNREQALNILDVNNQPQWYVGDSNEVLDDLGGMSDLKSVKIKISVKSLKQKFHPCSDDYIKNVCQGRCCQGAKGISVSVHDSEIDKITELGATIENNLIIADNRGLCPFKSDTGFCTIHNDKPLACKASPFIFSSNNVLIVRNRYRLMKCYNREGSIPVYKAHRWSLIQIFGEKITDYITNKMDAGCNSDFFVRMKGLNYTKIMDCQKVRTGKTVGTFDFVFSCPPYADLEVYSDLEGDISNMPYIEFMKAYESIINKSCKLLKSGGYACFVVGEVRDKKGNYIGFVPDTINAFKKCGMNFYNEGILLNSIASASMRANGNMKSEKLVKVHQNVLIFKKL